MDNNISGGAKATPHTSSETVAAVSTPFGKGGIAVIRISGDDSVAVAEKVFLPADGKALGSHPARSAVFGSFLSGNEKIDTGIAVVYRAPGSYTGEDTVELSCHGGILVTETVLEAVFEAGALCAGPGEFTKRAFLAGKLSLTEAEAVAAIIDADSREALKLASLSSASRLSREVDEIRKGILHCVSQVYVSEDYPDEELSTLPRGELYSRLLGCYSRVCALCDSYRRGHAVAEGIPCAIVGRPNAGKSSLLNRLLGRDRAIVSPEAGTTRDTIEETAPCGRILLRLSDTAGIREGSASAEALGIERTYSAIATAELIIAVFDGSNPLCDEDEQVLRAISGASCPKLAAISKSDLPSVWDDASLSEMAQKYRFDFAGLIRFSSLTGDGTANLSKAAEELFFSGEVNYSLEPTVANARQHAALEAAKRSLSAAVGALDKGFSEDMCALDCEDALASLGLCDGRAVTEEIVGDIFARFCVGK